MSQSISARSSLRSRRSKTLLLTQLAIFTALEIVFCFTPLGSIPISAGIVATLAHIPPLIVALTLGPWAALYMGGVMGVCSLIYWIINSAYPTAFVFTPTAPNGNFMSLVICILPRLLFPLFAALLYQAFRKHIKSVPAAIVAACTSTLAHSVMVLGLIYLTFHNQPIVGGNFLNFVIAWAGVNALIEIASAGLVCGGLILPLEKVRQRIA